MRFSNIKVWLNHVFFLKLYSIVQMIKNGTKLTQTRNNVMKLDQSPKIINPSFPFITSSAFASAKPDIIEKEENETMLAFLKPVAFTQKKRDLKTKPNSEQNDSMVSDEEDMNKTPTTTVTLASKQEDNGGKNEEETGSATASDPNLNNTPLERLLMDNNIILLSIFFIEVCILSLAMMELCRKGCRGRGRRETPETGSSNTTST